MKQKLDEAAKKSTNFNTPFVRQNAVRSNKWGVCYVKGDSNRYTPNAGKQVVETIGLSGAARQFRICAAAI